MSMEQPRNDTGQFVSLQQYFEMLLGERFDALKLELAHRQVALELQAAEYERRLEALNHAHARALDAQHTFLTIDKYEDQVAAAEAARALALARVDEKVGALSKHLDDRLKPLQEFKDKALGFGALVSVMSAVFGSLITAVVLGLF